jgi:Enoyl-CoA hydratase (EC 4.2.1.17)
MTREFETIRLSVSEGIATIELHRPDRLNAFTGRMMQELIAAFDATDGDDAVRAVIVTGAGRAFCAGADLSEGASTFDYAARSDRPAAEAGAGGPIRPDGTVDYAHEAVRDGGGRVALRIFESLKPVIAAVNGPAVGVGATMQLPMDVRIAVRRPGSASSSPVAASCPRRPRPGSSRGSSASARRSNGV